MCCVDQTHFVVCAINVQATESKKKYRSIIWQWRIATRQKRINEKDEVEDNNEKK